MSLNGVSYAATLVGDGAGNYSVTAGVPGQAVGYESGTITVVNANNNVSETWNNGFSVNVFDDLGSAAGLSATVAGPREVDLAWPTVSTSGYFDALQVERQGSADASPTIIATLAPGATGYADTTAVDGTSYQYAVALSASGFTSPNVGGVFAATPCLAPTALTATAVSLGETDLSWTNNSAGSSTFEVERSTDGANFSDIAGSMSNMSIVTGTTFADTTVQPATHYWYEVRAVGAAPSDTNYPTPTPSTFAGPVDGWSTPSAPTVSVGEVDSNQVALYITDSDPNAAANLSFAVQRSTDGGASYTAIDSVSASTYVDTSVSDGSAYSYEIIAVAPDGTTSAASSAVSASTPVGAVSAVTATEVSPTEIDLSWTPGGALDSTDSIIVERSTNYAAYVPVANNSLGSAATAYVDNTLSPDTLYSYRVSAVDSSGNALTGYAVVSAYTPPLAPSDLTATPAADGSSVTLTWTSNAAYGSGSPGFRILRSDDGSALATIDSVGLAVTSYADTNIVDGGRYQYDVVAISADQGGGSNSAISGFAQVPLLAPDGLTATPNGGNIVLSWKNNSETNTGYQILRADSESGLFTTILSVDGADQTSVADPTPPAGERLVYEVEATSGDLCSAASNTAVAYGPPTYGVSAPGSAQVGVPFQLSATTNITAAGTDPVARWSVDWGDGSTALASETSGGLNQFEHAYAFPRDYIISCTPLDADGMSLAGPMTATVSVLVPTVTLKETTPLGDYGGEFTFAPTYSAASSTLLGYYVDWGDGDKQSYTVGSVISHTYAPTAAVTKPNTNFEWLHKGIDYGVTFSALTTIGPLTQEIGTCAPSNNAQGPWGWYPNEEVPHEPTDGTLYLGVHPPASVVWTVDWGDGSPLETSSQPMGHYYGVNGTYVETVYGPFSPYGVISYTVPIVSHPLYSQPTKPNITALPGQSVTVDQPYTNLQLGGEQLTPNMIYMYTLGPGDQVVNYGTATFTGVEAGSIESTLTVPGPGIYSYRIGGLMPDRGYVNPAVLATQLYVWGASIGDGSSGQVLIATPSGSVNLLPLNLTTPAPEGEATTVTITDSNPSEDDLWATASPTAADKPVLGPDSPDPSATTFSFSSNGYYTTLTGAPISGFCVGATKGDTTPGVLKFTVSGLFDPLASHDVSLLDDSALASFGPVVSNGVSNASVTFKTAYDQAGRPILPVDNAAAVGDSQSNPGGYNPPVQLTEVDFVYPPDVPMAIAMNELRFWDSATGGNLVAGVPEGSAEFGASAPATTLYAEEIGEGGYNVTSDPYGSRFTISFGASATTTILTSGLGISMNGRAPGDPNAMVPTDAASAAEPPTSADFAKISLDVPANLPSGTQVNLSIDPSVTQEVDVYDSDPMADPSATALMGKDASEAGSYTWTTGTSQIPFYVYACYVRGSHAENPDPSFFTLRVQLPFRISAANGVVPAVVPLNAANVAPATASSSAASANAPSPATQPTTVATTQPVNVGHLIDLKFNAFIPLSKGVPAYAGSPPQDYNWGIEPFQVLQNISNALGPKAPINYWWFGTDNREHPGDPGTSRISTDLTFSSQFVGHLTNEEVTFQSFAGASHQVFAQIANNSPIVWLPRLIQTKTAAVASYFSIRNKKNESDITLHADAGFPFIDHAPHIVIDITWVILFYKKYDFILVYGSHTKFPSFEGIANGKTIYSYNATDSGPTPWNLGDYSFTKTDFFGQRTVLVPS